MSGISQPVVIASYSTPAEAPIAISRLVASGIQAETRDEFTVTFNWLLSDAIGGVKVVVASGDAAAAREALALPPTEPGLLQCPNCGSNETKVRALSVFGAICIFLKLPIPMTRAIVDCRRCGWALLRRTVERPWT